MNAKDSSQNVFQPNLKTAKRPFYNLMMFPYPSAEGLHVGNMYAFTGSDIYGRFMKLQGYDLFEPIGLDGFGIHSENYAIKKKTHPAKMAAITKKNFYRQLKSIGNAYAWDNTLETYDSNYYKWTQWIFIQMFKKGLAYQEKAPVNWCPSCKTVLADEQVENGVCERCKTKVVKKELKQWFFRITNYANRLDADLADLDWSEKVKVAQKNWIGKSVGAEIDFKIENSNETIKVFTTRIDTICSGTFLLLAPEHPLVEKFTSVDQKNEVKKYVEIAKKKSDLERQFDRQKTGVFIGKYAINPANGDKMPIWISDFVLLQYGTGAVFADAHDERDFEMAKQYKLPLKVSIKPRDEELWQKVKELKVCYPDDGILINSGKFDGLTSGEARKTITTKGEKEGWAREKTTYKLRDWLISRQRYWGPPIPIIHCDKCGAVSVPEKDLPVKLPETDNWRPKGTGESPLANIPEFVNTKCPKCKGPAKRETDVSDTFLDSAWYFFRYLDPKNKKQPFDKQLAKKWLPVDMYIGGAEHSVLHLLYVRFITYVFKEMGLINFDNPFKKFRAHGLIIKDGAKMSKSRGNVVVPDEYIKKYGSDVLRMYLMFIGPFTEGGDFRDTGINGISRFLDRVKKLFYNIAKNSKELKIIDNKSKLIHETVEKVRTDIENLNFNTAISQMMIFINKIQKGDIEGSQQKSWGQELSRSDREKFLIVLSPFAPKSSEELWTKLGHKESIFTEKWPEAKKIEKTVMFIPVMINGKKRALLEIETAKKLSEKEMIALAQSDESVKKWLVGKKIKKTIYIPGKIVNIVL